MPEAPASGVEPSGVGGEKDLFRSRPGAVWLPRDFVAVTGPDAVSFLQGQLSQDVRLEVGASAWSLLLSPQGKTVALLRLLREGEESFVLDTDAGWADAVLDRLRRFKLRVKCDLEPRRWRCLALRGDGSAGIADRAVGGDTSMHALVAAWPGLPGVDLAGPDPTVPAGVELVGTERYEAVRIEAGVPVMGRELTEATIPAEAGVVDRTVSFTKGCFTGQELVARIDSRGGNVPRRLRGVVLEPGVDEPPAGARLEVGGDEVGTLTSVAWSPALGAHVALAYVRRAVEPPAEATVAWDGAAAPASIQVLPLVP